MNRINSSTMIFMRLPGKNNESNRLRFAMHLFTLNLGRWQFRPGVWPTLAAVAFAVLTFSLGNWQMDRAAYKRSLQAQMDAGAHAPVMPVGEAPVTKAQMVYRQVSVQGVFDPRYQILLDNRIHDGVAGYHVLTPLILEGGHRALLVNRGWIPVGKNRSALPLIPTPQARVKITGLATDPDTRYFELGSAAPQGRVWQNLRFKSYAAWSGLDLQPFVLQQSNDSGDGLIRAWPRPDTGVATHLSYAMQWYGLTATLIVLWLVLNVKRKQIDGASY